LRNAEPFLNGMGLGQHRAHVVPGASFGVRTDETERIPACSVRWPAATATMALKSSRQWLLDSFVNSSSPNSDTLGSPVAAD
jgi:hypothetical protein